MATETSAPPTVIQERLAGLSPERRALIEKLLKKGSAKPAPPSITKRRVGGEIPLSFAQQRLWFFEQLMPGTTVYNMPLQLRLQSAINPPLLARALNELVRRHESFRTTFTTVEERPVQVVARSLKLEMAVIDLQDFQPEDRDASLLRLATEEALTRFDLTTGPLIRTKLLRLGAQDFVLLLTMHHIISDAWSMNIFLKELGVVYSAYASGTPSPLPELPIQYADYAVWQRNWLKGEVLDRQITYWKKHLEGITPINLPSDRPRPAVPSFHGASVPVHIPGDLLAKLRILSLQHECTIFMTMLASFQILLFRYTGQEDVVLGTPVANRNHAEIEGLIGFFINSLVVRANLAGNPAFLQALSRVREVALEAYAHQDVPFEMLVDQLQPERDLTRNPLFQVLFQLQSTAGTSADLGTGSGGGARHNAIFDLNTNFWELSDSIVGGLEYNADLFDQVRVERMVGHWEVLLKAIVEDPNRAIGELSILAESERRQLLTEWNATNQTYPKDRAIHELVEEQAARTPHAPALAIQGRSLTYEELVRQANQMARRLCESGVQRGDRVGICLERSLETVVAILAVLKAGAAYVPFDPEYPFDRLRFMFEDSAVRVLITRRALLDRLPQRTMGLLVLDDEAETISRLSDQCPVDVQTASEDTAYIIYTSGSTGTPKGVCVPHRCLVHSTWARLLFYREPPGRFLLLSPFAFDSSIAGIFWTLCSGGCLEIATESETADPLTLATRIQRSNITHLLTVPSLYTVLVDALDQAVTQLKVAIVAGEPCPGGLVRNHFDRLPGVALYNEYGPTEASVWATVFHCQREDKYLAPPIGRPIANTRVYIVDRNGQLVPAGVPGELWIGGEGVARGYWNRQDLTDERFIPDPFAQDGSRVYRTGDLARYLFDGNIEFCGRLDEQVKVRGYRIELGEIEAALRSHPSVAECAAYVWKHNDDVRLAACAVPLTEPAEASDVIAFLQQRLPSYMVPPSITWVTALPRNANGKLDRAALTADPQPSSTVEEYVAPRTDLEQSVAMLYMEVLGVKRPGIHDNFFQLGGHSLLATQLLSRVNKTFQLQLILPVLFESPTIASLAAVIEESLLDEIAGLSEHEVERLVEPQQSRRITESENG